MPEKPKFEQVLTPQQLEAEKARLLGEGHTEEEVEEIFELSRERKKILAEIEKLSQTKGPAAIEEIKELKKKLDKVVEERKEIEKTMLRRTRPEEFEKEVTLEEKEARELVEKELGGIFLGTKEIKEAFSLYDKRGNRTESLIPDQLPEKPLPDKEKIEKIAETFKELGYTKWGLIRLVSKDKNGADINIDWLNGYFKTDPRDKGKPKDQKTKLIYQDFCITSDKPDDIKIRKKPLEDEWVVIALDCASDSETTNKNDQEQQKIVDKLNKKEKNIKFYTPEANEDIYSVLAVYLKTGQKLRKDPYIWLRTASRSAGESVIVGGFGARGLWVVQWWLGDRSDFVGPALSGV